MSWHKLSNNFIKTSRHNTPLQDHSTTDTDILRRGSCRWSRVMYWGPRPSLSPDTDHTTAAQRPTGGQRNVFLSINLVLLEYSESQLLPSLIYSFSSPHSIDMMKSSKRFSKRVIYPSLFIITSRASPTVFFPTLEFNLVKHSSALCPDCKVHISFHFDFLLNFGKPTSVDRMSPLLNTALSEDPVRLREDVGWLLTSQMDQYF